MTASGTRSDPSVAKSIYTDAMLFVESLHAYFVNHGDARSVSAQLRKITKFDKQLQAIPFPEIRSTLNDRWEVDVLRRLIALEAPVMIVGDKRNIYEILVDRHQDMNMLLVSIMDCYTLPRMFRPWMEFIFVYVGQNHAQNYRYFMNGVDFRTIASISEKQSSSKCLDVSSIDWNSIASYRFPTI